MPYVGDFDPMDAGEDELLAFDFVNTLRQAGDAISTCSWVVKRQSDQLDVSTDVADGAPIVVGTKVVQRVKSMQAGYRYVMVAKVVTNHGDHLSLWGHVDCTEPA